MAQQPTLETEALRLALKWFDKNHSDDFYGEVEGVASALKAEPQDVINQIDAATRKLKETRQDHLHQMP